MASASYANEFKNVATGAYQGWGSTQAVSQTGSITIYAAPSRAAGFTLQSGSNAAAGTVLVRDTVNISHKESIYGVSDLQSHVVTYNNNLNQPSMSIGTYKTVDGHSVAIKIQSDASTGTGYEINSTGLRQVAKGSGGTDPASYIISSSTTGNTVIKGDYVGDTSGTAYFAGGNVYASKIYGTFIGEDGVQVNTSSYDNQNEGAMLMMTASDSDSDNLPTFPLTLQIHKMNTTNLFEEGDGPGILFKMGTDTYVETDRTVTAGAIAVAKYNDTDSDNRTNMNFWINDAAGAPAEFEISDIAFQISASKDIKTAKDIVGFVSSFSDERLKENILPICSSLDIVTKLQGTTFNWNESSSKAGQFNAGLIAQNVEKVIPHIVTEHNPLGNDNKNYKSVKYQEVIPYLVEAIKEQQTQIEDLKKQVKKLNRKSKRK